MRLQDNTVCPRRESVGDAAERYPKDAVIEWKNTEALAFMSLFRYDLIGKMTVIT